MKELAIVKPEVYGGQHPKDYHPDLSEIFQESVQFIIIN